MKLAWNPTFFKVLGIWLSTNLDECVEKNYNEKFEECNRLFREWIRRQITPIGRVAVLKSLILSKLIHLWILLPDPPDKTITEMQKSCFKFVWEYKTDKIGRAFSVKSVKDGGINIPDIRSYITALKLTWIRKYHNTTHKWKTIVDAICPYMQNINKYGPSATLIKPNKNAFWVDCFKALRQFHECCQPNSNESVLAEPIFYNNNLLIGGQPIWDQVWFDKGIYRLADFFNDNGCLYSSAEFCAKYGVNENILKYSCVQKSFDMLH